MTANYRHKFKDIKAFTLLEVLVALAVLSIAMIPLVKTPVAVASNQSFLKAKTFAGYVALNKIAELHLDRKFPSLGTKKGSELMAGREFFWKSKVVKANSLFKGIRRIELTVYAQENDDDSEIITMISLVGKPK